MSDDDAAWRERTRRTKGARMNGDGFGSPPWGPADPVPALEDTQALPGLGSVPGPGERSGRPHAGQGYGPEQNGRPEPNDRPEPNGRAGNAQAPNGPGPESPPLNGSGTGGRHAGSGTKRDAAQDE